jgi:NAD(P)-dependent dehydrogenase (short-subunit alcohol dehydrogenase family)
LFLRLLETYLSEPDAIAYSAAKAGIINMMKVLAWELGPHRIRVNTVNPGAIQTDMASRRTVELSMKYWPRFWEMAAARVCTTSAEHRHVVCWLLLDEADT